MAVCHHWRCLVCCVSQVQAHKLPKGCCLLCDQVYGSSPQPCCQPTAVLSGRTHLASLMKRVTLSLLSLMFSSRMSSLYRSAARRLATAPTPCKSAAATHQCITFEPSPAGSPAEPAAMPLCTGRSNHSKSAHGFALTSRAADCCPCRQCCCRQHAQAYAEQLRLNLNTASPVAAVWRPSVQHLLCHPQPHAQHSLPAGSCPPEQEPARHRNQAAGGSEVGREQCHIELYH